MVDVSHWPLPILRSFLTTSTIWMKSIEFNWHTSLSMDTNLEFSIGIRATWFKLQIADAVVRFLRSVFFLHTLISSSRSSRPESKALETTLTLLFTNTDELNSQPRAKPTTLLRTLALDASLPPMFLTAKEAGEETSDCILFTKPRALVHLETATERKCLWLAWLWNTQWAVSYLPENADMIEKKLSSFFFLLSQ